MWASEPESDRAQGELLPGLGRPRDLRARAETFSPLPPPHPALSLQTHKKEIEWLRGRCTFSKTEAQPGSAEAWRGRLPSWLPAPRWLCPSPRVNPSPDSGPGPGSPELRARERVFLLAALLSGEALSLT